MVPFISVNCIKMILFFVGYPLILDACSQEGKTIAGRYLSGAAFIQVPKSSLFSCAAACVSYSICKSFNFEKVSRNCTLNVDNELTGTYVLVDDANSLYSNIDTWAKEIAGPCKHHVCILEEVCFVTRNKQTACVPSLIENVEFRIDLDLKEERLIWTDAVISCEQLGGRLAVLDTPGKNKIVIDQIEAIGYDSYVWFGLSDRAEENVFRWITGTAVDYTIWSDLGRQPNNYRDKEHCGGIINNTDNSRIGWFDLNCESKFYYVCEFVRPA